MDFKGLSKIAKAVKISPPQAGKFSESVLRFNGKHRHGFMIFIAVKADGIQINDITARAGVFNQEEVPQTPNPKPQTPNPKPLTLLIY
jgi:hypothetical protein